MPGVRLACRHRWAHRTASGSKGEVDQANCHPSRAAISLQIIPQSEAARNHAPQRSFGYLGGAAIIVPRHHRPFQRQTTQTQRKGHFSTSSQLRGFSTQSAKSGRSRRKFGLRVRPPRWPRSSRNSRILHLDFEAENRGFLRDRALVAGR
jgi:hypothetical protein